MGGLLAVLAFATVRLAFVVADALSFELTGWQWVLLVANLVFLAWAEGYRGFQLRFSPRTVARARYLYDHPNAVRVTLAPLFVTGYIQSGKRTRVAVWAGTVAIIVLILLVHRLDQPLRGIIDAGVVVGLSWGIVTLLHGSWLAMANRVGADPDVPEEESKARTRATSAAG